MLSKYKRILLKYSGAALAGEREFGLDMQVIRQHAEQIKKLRDRGMEICLQMGGGNIFRGNSDMLRGIPRNTADQIGMLSTIINGIAMQNVLEDIDVETRLMSAISLHSICELYIRRRAQRHLEKGRIVICIAGTGNAFFTTDTAASLRAADLNCGLIMKGTLVDGVYSDDPLVKKGSKRISCISHQEVLSRNLQFMDTTAIALARDCDIPIVVFSMLNPKNLLGVFDGHVPYTFIGQCQ